MLRAIWIAIAFLISIALLTVLGTAASTQFVLQALVGLGVEIPMGLWLNTMVEDIQGMGPVYGAVVAVGFTVAMIAAGLVARQMPGLRLAVFAVAGMVAMIVTLLILPMMFFGVMPIAGARSELGFAAQALVAGFAGLVFALLTPPRRA